MQAAQQLGRYEILAELGRGAMGRVFRARDPRIDRTVAIKTISVPGAGAAELQEYRQRFFREAQAAGRLSHPGIVTIFDADEDASGATPFIVMEFVDGRPLDDYAQNAEFVEAVAPAPVGRLPLETAIDLVQQIAAALDYAHASGIVHRDIKPSNIIVTEEGRAKIADFGIAKLSMVEATLPGHILGTPAYMSPEQLSGKPIDGRSDLFSLGVIAYWLFTGEKPFTGASITEVSIQVATKDPRPASEVAPALSKDFDYVLARALAKDPLMRYQRGKDLAADLEDLRLGHPPRSASADAKTMLLAAVSPTRPANSKIAPAVTADAGPAKRRSALLYICVALVLLLAVAAVFAFGFNRNLPASLQIVGQYPFSNGEIYIWVDGDLRYHDNIHRAAAHPHGKKDHASPDQGEALAVTLPVRAGRHTVRVQVDAPGNAFDRDTSIPGEFRAFSHKTLQVDFSGRNLQLQWQ
ncbi:MAG TPA: serine/threonine-protein kinase [Candidatus Angelobacter sp.]